MWFNHDLFVVWFDFVSLSHFTKYIELGHASNKQHKQNKQTKQTNKTNKQTKQTKTNKQTTPNKQTIQYKQTNNTKTKMKQSCLVILGLMVFYLLQVHAIRLVIG